MKWAHSMTSSLLATARNNSGKPKTKTRAVYMIGNDAKAGFIGHVLQDIYGKVEWISAKGPGRYSSIILRPKPGDEYNSFPNHSLKRTHSYSPPRPSETILNAHISDLVITQVATKTLINIRHRINHETTICVFLEGLGYVEKLEREVFQDMKRRPSFILGHITRPYLFNRKYLAIKQVPRDYSRGITYLTQSRSRVESHGQIADKLQQRSRGHFAVTDPMLQNLEAASYLDAEEVAFDTWFRIKLPAMVFASVIDPICTTLVCRYDQVLSNPRGPRMIDQLLLEVCGVIETMPEAHSSQGVSFEFRYERLRHYCLGQVRAKGKSPSPMSIAVTQGRWTDIDFLTGYFVQRGLKAGVCVSALMMVMSIVKARQAQQLTRIDSYVPWDEASKHLL
jgi:cytochrome b translational activator protein CBS2